MKDVVTEPVIEKGTVVGAEGDPLVSADCGNCVPSHLQAISNGVYLCLDIQDNIIYRNTELVIQGCIICGAPDDVGALI